jgi:hypothetical protein
MFAPTYNGFCRFCKVVGYELRPFQRRIARAHFATEREVVAILPRGSAKSTLASRIAVHHVLSRERPGVYIGAASRDQARIIGAMVRELSLHPAIAKHVVWRLDALRWASDPKGSAVLQIVASDGSKAHGWPRPTLIIADELWAWQDREPSLLGAMLSSMLKNPACRFLGISTAASSMDTPLGRLRIRALGQPHVERVGAVLQAGGGGLAWIEYSVGDDQDPEDLRVVAAANPLRTIAELREQRPRVSEREWLQFHCCRFGGAGAALFKPGRWQACGGQPDFQPGEQIVIAVDASKGVSDAAVIWMNDRHHVGVEIWEGTGSAQAVDDIVGDLASQFVIRELTADPWHVVGLLTERWEQRGLVVSEWPQYDSRAVPATERLIRVVDAAGIVHGNDPKLNEHIEGSMLVDTRRGPRLAKRKGRNNDGAVGLMMCLDRLEHVPERVEVLAWVG